MYTNTPSMFAMYNGIPEFPTFPVGGMRVNRVGSMDTGRSVAAVASAPPCPSSPFSLPVAIDAPSS